MSLRPEPNESLARLNPSISPELPELLVSAALVIETAMAKKPVSDEYLKKAIREHEVRERQLKQELLQKGVQLNETRAQLAKSRRQYIEELKQDHESAQPQKKALYRKQCEELEKPCNELKTQYDRMWARYTEELEYGTQLRNRAKELGLPLQDRYPSFPLGVRLQQPVKRLKRNIMPPARTRETTLCDVMRNLLQRLYQLLLSLRHRLQGRPPSALPGNHKVRASQQLFSASATPKPPLEQAPAPIQAACLAAGA